MAKIYLISIIFFSLVSAFANDPAQKPNETLAQNAPVTPQPQVANSAQNQPPPAMPIPPTAQPANSAVQPAAPPPQGQPQVPAQLNAPPPQPQQMAPPPQNPQVNQQPSAMPIPPDLNNPQNSPIPPPQTILPPPEPPVAKIPEAPADLELIGIKPYFKNKPKIAKMTAQLILTSTGNVLATVSGNLGDCKDCLRGASLKSKIGIRFYGSDLLNLNVSRKQSSSVKIISCPQQTKLVNNAYNCEFMHQDKNFKIMVRIEP